MPATRNFGILTMHNKGDASRPSKYHPITILATIAIAALGLLGCGEGTGDKARLDTVSHEAANATPSRPNILLIMVDDLGFNDLAINNNNQDIDTPNLDALARSGVRYTRHYAAAVCSPARAALLTGLHPERLGFLPNGKGISPEFETLPERLKAEGYNTWHLGKWHVGHLYRGAWPDHQGFDHWLGFLSQWHLAGQVKDGDIKLTRPRYNDPWLQGDREPGRHFSGHLETILTRKATEVMTELSQRQQPWLLNLWYYAPHTPINPAPEFASRYPDTPAGRYQAHVNQLDHNIGKLLEHLEAIGAHDDTIVVVVSDNGGTNRQLDNNAPFGGGKSKLTEGGLRTPLLVRWPDQAMNGVVVDSTVAIQDIYPTLLAAIGLDVPPGLDGISFYRAAGESHATGERPLFWQHGPGSGMLSGDGRWRLYQPNRLFGIDRPLELYDLQADPSGAQPVVAPEPRILGKLVEQLETWYHDIQEVPTSLAQLEDGRYALTGASFQRTPGIGGYTFAVAIDEKTQGTLVEQAGTWSLSRSGDQLTARFGAYQLAGTIPTHASCHSVIISGIFYRRLSSSSGPDHVDLRLYVDGVNIATVREEGYVEADNTNAPTVLAAMGSGTALNVPKPVILNLPIEASPFISLDTLRQRLCPPV